MNTIAAILKEAKPALSTHVKSLRAAATAAALCRRLTRYWWECVIALAHALHSAKLVLGFASRSKNASFATEGQSGAGLGVYSDLGVDLGASPVRPPVGWARLGCALAVVSCLGFCLFSLPLASSGGGK